MLETLLNSATDSTTLWFAVTALLLFVIAIVLGSVAVFQSELAEKEYVTKTSLMPTFEELRSAEASLGDKRRERDELREEMKTLRVEQAEIQRHQLDAQHWQSLAEQAKRDYDNRQELVDEVEELRSKHENAANDLAARNEEIDDLVRKRNALGEEIGDIEARRDEAERLNREIEDKQERLDEIREALSKEEDLREAMYQARFEVDQLARRKADLENDLEKLPEEVEGLTEEKQKLQEEVDRLRRVRDELRDIEEKIEHLLSRKSALEAKIEEFEKQRDDLHGELIVHAPADVEKLPEEVALRAVEDLWREPSCLFDQGVMILKDRWEVDSEHEALEGVSSYLDELGLKFESDLIKQFHTSLKISRISPLTVLAGISGTGKSLLPQRYAEAMGIPFLKVAVQPSWDSPQDLLGFYNYLEKSYKATELARAMIFMDPNSVVTEHLSQTTRDHLLLVLLDEMNLARVEYYFSEFLSRLEGRPDPGEGRGDILRPSRINIDVPLSKAKSVSIYPGHNTLFVGTMNEDESTQSLSEKVLDRGNAIRFKRPHSLVTRLGQPPIQPREEFLEFDTWASWYRCDLPENKTATLNDNVNTLNEHLETLGRPFGFRVYQAIYAYAANHPDFEDTASEDRALSEMMTMRILPKLRGIELGTSEQRAVNEIAGLVRDKLNDEELATLIISSIGEDGMFTWRG